MYMPQHQENVIYYGTLQTTTEHYVVLCSKIQPTDERISRRAVIVSVYRLRGAEEKERRKKGKSKEKLVKCGL
jgi:hypothetical protein